MGEEVIKTILARRSIRKYTDDPVSEENIKTILEAAMAAPSASNKQPWHYIVVTDRSTLDSLANAHQYAQMLRQAPLCIVVCGDESINPRFWSQDCSAATQNILIAVQALDLGAVWCGVYPREARVKNISTILGIESPVIPLNLIAVGHPDEEKEPRTQYNDNRVHRDKW